MNGSGRIRHYMDSCGFDACYNCHSDRKRKLISRSAGHQCCQMWTEVNSCADKGSKGYHLSYLSCQLVPYTGSWQITVFQGNGNFFGADEQGYLCPGSEGCNYFKDCIADRDFRMPIFIRVHNTFQYRVNADKPGNILVLRTVKNIMN